VWSVSECKWCESVFELFSESRWIFLVGIGPPLVVIEVDIGEGGVGVGGMFEGGVLCIG